MIFPARHNSYTAAERVSFIIFNILWSSSGLFCAMTWVRGVSRPAERKSSITHVSGNLHSFIRDQQIQRCLERWVSSASVEQITTDRSFADRLWRHVTSFASHSCQSEWERDVWDLPTASSADDHYEQQLRQTVNICFKKTGERALIDHVNRIINSRKTN